MDEEKKSKIKVVRTAEEQIGALWMEQGRIWAKLSELESILRDASDGLYRRKVRPKEPEAPPEKDDIDKLIEVLTGGIKPPPPPKEDALNA